MEEVRSIDAETEFLASKKESGNEWELFKENVRPLKRGRNASLLNHSLRSHSDPLLKKSLLQHRRRLIEAIDEYEGDDPLQPWIECIKWVQESFPAGGEWSGLVVIYEQCVRSFWHSDRYKEDLRYLKVWLEYADNCADAEVIFSFLEANQIGQTHSLYYISYASHMESKNKLRKADEIFNLGIARNSQPMEKLKAAYKKFLLHSAKRSKASENEPIDDQQPVRSFGTLLAGGEARRQDTQKSDLSLGGRNTKLQRIDGNVPFTIYKDTNNRTTARHQPESLKSDLRSWQTLGTQRERNKENAAAPSKWASNKIPQRAGSRTQPATSTLEVFIDEECAEVFSMAEHLASIFGTEKDRVNCPFYFKIGACRHGDRCSRLHNRPTISPTLLLSNMYQRPDMITPGVDPQGQPIDPRKIQEHFEDFYEDIFEELSKFGEIESLNICDNLADHMVGNVYVQFKEEDQAAAALQALQGRFYSGRPIIVDFSPVTDFREATCRQFEENSCNRGGYCNFMHVKQIGRELRRKLFGRYQRSRGSRSRSRSLSPHRRRDYDRRDYRDRGDFRGNGGRGGGGGDRYGRYDSDPGKRRHGSPRRTRSPVREGSEERRARIEQWNREREAQR